MGNQLRRSGRGEEAMRKRDIRLTRIAIVIVGVFIICHLPRFIPNIVEMVMALPRVILKAIINSVWSIPTRHNAPPSTSMNILYIIK